MTDIAGADLAPVRSLYENGWCLQAYRASAPWGPLARWEGTRARILAARLAHHLGAPRLASTLALSAWRRDRSDPEAIYYGVFALFHKLGPYPAWKALRTAPRTGDLDLLRASILATVRDHERAWEWWRKAEEAESAWRWAVRAQILTSEDRFEEALEAARKALELRPRAIFAVRAAADGLVATGRDREALELLESSGIESCALLAELVHLQVEMQRPDDAERTLARIEEISPIREKKISQWIAAHRRDIAYRRGDREGARRWAAQAGDADLAERLEAGPGERIVHEVPFVRQHHDTCAPATLAMLAKFWSQPAHHLEIAEEICYDGTPWHGQRAWAVRHGWAVREFTVTWDSAAALLRRGVPFALTLVHPLAAHLQAVIGFDDRRKTLLIRDPNFRERLEYDAASFLESQRSTGPRGMAMVPSEKAELLDLELPDAELYDLLHGALSDLEKHRRDGAERGVAELERRSPGHRIALHARRALSQYDRDPRRLLDTTDRLLALFPGDEHLLLLKLSLLRDLEGGREVRVYLEDLRARGRLTAILGREYARELSADSREQSRAEWWLRSSLRENPFDAENLLALAALLWEQGRKEEALESYRWASCLEEKKETYSAAFFQACRLLEREEEGLSFLRKRLESSGARSSLPARTLANALDAVGKSEEALAVLDGARVARPGDSELLLHSSDFLASCGRDTEARALLSSAADRCNRADWLSVAARLETHYGDLARARGYWSELVEANPLNVAAHHELARLIAGEEGRARAREHIERAILRFPRYVPFHWLRLSWSEHLGESAAAVEEILKIQPEDAAARGERARVLLEMGQLDEALAEAREAIELQPRDGRSHGLLARVLARLGRLEAARASFEEGLSCTVEDPDLLREGMELCRDAAEKRAWLARIREEIVRQGASGPGTAIFRSLASSMNPPAEVLADLRRILERWPSSWVAWSVTIEQHVSMNQGDEALELARKAVVRFPMCATLRLTMAYAHRVRKEEGPQIEALREAARLAPGDPGVLVDLYEALERAGDLDGAKKVLAQASVRNPMDAAIQGMTADLEWKAGRKTASLDRLERAIRLDPRYEWGWSSLVQRGKDRAAALIESLVALHPRDVGLRLRLVDFRSDGDRLRAVDEALAIDARSEAALERRALLLSEQGRFEEARETCGRLPGSRALRGCAAWIRWLEGDRKKAIEMLQEIVRDEPGSVPAWVRLAEWQESEGRNQDALVSAAQAVVLQPRVPDLRVQLARLHMKRNDPASAKRCLEEAAAIDATCAQAVNGLFDLRLEGGDWSGAEEMLRLVRLYQEPLFAANAEFRLAHARRNLDVTREALRGLASRGDADLFVWQAYDAMVKSGDAGSAVEVFAEFLEKESASAEVARLWSLRNCFWQDWRKVRKAMRRLADRPALWARCAEGYVDGLAEAGSYWSLRWFVSRNRERLQRFDRTWAAVGMAYHALRDYRRAAGWMSDWARREVGPGVWLTLALVFREVGRDEEATEISRRALELDGRQPLHPLWIGLEEAASGNMVAARGWMAPFREDELDPAPRVLYVLTKAMILAREGRFREAKQELRRAGFMQSGIADPSFHRLYRRAVRDVGRLRGGLAGWWFRLWI